MNWSVSAQFILDFIIDQTLPEKPLEKALLDQNVIFGESYLFISSVAWAEKSARFKQARVLCSIQHWYCTLVGDQGGEGQVAIG